MIRFSRREDYAMILVNKLASEYNKRLVPLSEVAKEYNISLLFLRNLAHELRIQGLIKAVEGKKGGYFLSEDPHVLKVGKILEIFSRKPMLECCHELGIGDIQKKCPQEGICAPGYIWRQLNKEFLEKVYNLTLVEFMNYKKTA